jgi:PAS domain S-box-containing protein
MTAQRHDTQLFRQVFDACPDGVLLVDGQGLIVLANPAAAALLGYRVDELEGLPVDRLVPDRVAPRHAAHRQAYSLAPKSRPMGSELELMARRADGSEVMVEIALGPLRAGDADFVVASVRGIGAYPRVKHAMQRAHYNEFVVQLGRVAVDTLDPDELLRRMPALVCQALEVQGVSVFLLTPNQLELRAASFSGLVADADGPIVYPNRPDTLMGYAVAQRAPLVVANLAREQRFDVPAPLLQAGARSGLAVPLIDRGKVIGTLAAWSNQLNRFGDDEVAFFVALATLLSNSLQRAQAESQLRHAQRMETVGQLTGGVAHDFNNLLTVIQGNLQLLDDQPAVRNDPLARQLVAAASRAGQRGADLTGKLLAFARRQTLEPRPVDASAMLHSLGEMLRRTLGENIRITVQTPAHCPPCLADPVQLESALLNVAVNARDAMPRGGSLVLRCGSGEPPDVDELSTAPGSLDGAADHRHAARDWVWLSLQDTGVGMTRQVLDRAFEPFFTTKETGRGTGLGLSTVYGFIKQSHGHIKIDSAPGAGTKVTMYLPALAGDEQEDVAAAVAVESIPQGLRVLLVEDDADVRNVAEAFLQSLGCEVMGFDNGEAALAEIGRGHAFDLLLSDITLGAGIDGDELARRVHRRHPALPVLLTSGYSRHMASGSRPGAPMRWPVLNKPYTRHDLAHAIAQCLQGSAA